jgi:hypothetical protein
MIAYHIHWHVACNELPTLVLSAREIIYDRISILQFQHPGRDVSIFVTAWAMKGAE